MEAAADLGLRMGVEGGRETLSVLQQLQTSIERLTGSIDRLEARSGRTRGAERMAQGAKQATTNLNAMATQADRSGRAIGVLHQHQERYISSQARSAAVFGTQIGLLRQMQISLISVGAALSVRAVVNYADSWQYASNRLKIATNSLAELKRAQTELFDVSQRTFSTFRSSAEIFARYERSTRSLGMAQSTLSRLTETTQKAVALSGATAASAEGALYQFGQALATNFRNAGQEMASVMEQVPRLAEAIAFGLGLVTKSGEADIGKLRTMYLKGELTTEKAVMALRRASASLDADFKKLTPTFSQLFTRINENIGKMLGQSTAMEGLRKVIKGIADNFHLVELALKGLMPILTLMLANSAITSGGKIYAGLMEAGSALKAKQAGLKAAALAEKEYAAMVAVAVAAEKTQRISAIEGVATAKASALAAAQSSEVSALAKLKEAKAAQAAMGAEVALAQARRAAAMSNLQMTVGMVTATGRGTIAGGMREKASVELREAMKAEAVRVAYKRTVDAEVASATAALVAAKSASASARREASVAVADHQGAVTRMQAATARAEAAALRSRTMIGRAAAAVAVLGTAVASVGARIGTVMAGLLTVMGGWPGVIILAIGALVVFHKEIASLITGIEDADEAWKKFGEGFQKNIADPISGLGIILGDTLNGVATVFAETIIGSVDYVQRRLTELTGRTDRLQKDERPATERVAVAARTIATGFFDANPVFSSVKQFAKVGLGYAGQIGAEDSRLKEFQKNLTEAQKNAGDFYKSQTDSLGLMNDKALGLVEAFNELRENDIAGFTEKLKELKLPPDVQKEWETFFASVLLGFQKSNSELGIFLLMKDKFVNEGLMKPGEVPPPQMIGGADAAFEQQAKELRALTDQYRRGVPYAESFSIAVDIVERAAKETNETLTDTKKFEQAQLVMDKYGDTISGLKFAYDDARAGAQAFFQLATDKRLVDALDPSKGGGVTQRRIADRIAQTFGRLGAGDLRPGSAKRNLAEAQINVEDRGVIAKASADLAVARDNLTHLNKAVADGEAGLRVYETALSMASQSGGVLTQEMLDLAKSIDAVNQKQVEMRLEASLNSQREALERLQSSLGSYRQFQEALKANEFISQGASEEAARALAASAVEFDRATERLQKAGDNLSRMDIEPFEQFADEMSSIPADFFDQFRDEGFAAFDDLGSYFKKTFKRLANEIVIQSVLKPLFDPIFKAFSEGISGANPGNVPGGPSPRKPWQSPYHTPGFGDMVGAPDAGGFGSDNIGSMQVRAPNGRITITANVVNLNAPVAGAGGTGALDAYTSAGSNSRLPSDDPFGTFATPTESRPGATGAGGSLDSWFKKQKQSWDQVEARFTDMFNKLGEGIGKIFPAGGKAVSGASKALGSAAAGAAAGYAGYQTGVGMADMLGVDGGKTGGKIGGAVGGGIGFAIAGPAGAAVGAAIGGFFGKIFGSLFGRKTATGTLDLDTGERSVKDSKKGSRNERRDIVLDSTADAISRLADALGASFAPGYSIQVKAGKKNIATSLLDASGNVVATGAKVGAKDVAGAVNEGLKLALKQVLEGGDATLRRLSDALMAANVPVETLVNTVSKIGSILELTKEPVSEFRSAIEEMQKVFKDAARASGEYGEAIQQLTAIQLEAFKALASKFDRDLQRAIMEIEDPVGGQLLDLLKTQRERTLDAEALNKALSDAGDGSGAVARMNEVFKLNTLELQKFLEELADTPESLAQAAKAFEAYRTQLEEMGVESASITAALTAAKAQAASAFNKQISKDVLELRSPTMAAFQALLAQQKELETFAQTVGGNIFATQARNALERQKFFENLSDEEKRELGDFLGLIQDDFGRIGVVLQMLEDQMARYIDRAEEQREATLRAAEAFKSYKDSLDDTILDIQKQYGKGPPQERLQTLQGEFTRLAGAARGGDESAFGRLGGLSQEILSQARALYAGTSQFSTIRDAILGELTGLSQFAGDRSASLYREVDQMDTEIEALREIRNLLSDDKSTPILQDILDAGRIQNDITRSLVTELISLRSSQEQAQAVTLGQLQQQSFQYLQGQPSSFSNDNDATAERETQQLVARSYQDFSRQQATTNQLIAKSNQKLDDLSAEIRRDRNQRTLEG